MSRKITQPVNQVRLTNVAVVRMNRNGKRFEVACYRNKAVNYRQGIETDLDEVLQTDRVFANVSKGEFANKSDLQKAFPQSTYNEEEICQIILKRGQLQISDMERSTYIENTAREIAAMVAEKCVNPKSNRPYTIQVIRDSMKDAEFAVNANRSVKLQFLECVKLLKKKNVLPIERAKMHLCAIIPIEQRGSIEKTLIDAGVEILVPPPADGEQLQQQQQQQQPQQQQQHMEDTGTATTATASDNGGGRGREYTRFEFLIDPSLYRSVDEIVKRGCTAANDEGNVSKGGNTGGTGNTTGGGRLEIVRQCVHEEGDAGLELELERRKKKEEDRLLVPPSSDSAGLRVGSLEHVIEDDDDNDDNDDDDANADIPRLRITGNDEENMVVEDDDDDDDVGRNSLRAKEKAKKMTKAAVAAHDTRSDDDDEELSNLVPKSSQTTNKKAQKDKKKKKKSKKARRREREEAEERQKRIDAERHRREEREARLRAEGKLPPQDENDDDDENDRNINVLDGTDDIIVDQGKTRQKQLDSADQTATTKTKTNTQKSCNTCGGSFTPVEYRAHFRGDWHRYNLKLKLNGIKPISEKEFQLCDADSFFNTN